MAQTTSLKRTVNPAYYIVCEGKNTEPDFFYGLTRYLVQGGYINNKNQIRIYPTPVAQIDAARGQEESTRRGSYSGKKRTTKSVCIPDEKTPPGPQPLNWVVNAIQTLDANEGIDIAWAVFDKDGHPEAEAAFNKAAEARASGKEVHIGFSSISFEQYLLLHFGFYTHAFSKSKCINGYAGRKEFWPISRGKKVDFDRFKNKLWTGVYNAKLLRILKGEGDGIKIWEINPYTTVDKLVSSLLGYTELKLDAPVSGSHFMVTLQKDALLIERYGNGAQIINKRMFSYLHSEDKGQTFEVDSKQLYPGEQHIIPLSQFGEKALVAFEVDYKHKVFFVV